MYAIREEPQNARLRITLSGRVPTDEALRAVRQASMLLRTDSLNEVICDVTLVHRGPGKLMLFAAFMAAECPARARLAIIAGDWQLRIAQRLLRFSGLGYKARCFSDELVAFDWLAQREAPVRPVSRNGALPPAAGDVATVGVEAVVRAHRAEELVDVARLALADLVHGGLHVVVDAPAGHTAERREGTRVGVEQHLVALAGVGHQPEGAAGAQLEMRHLQALVHAADDYGLFAPV